MNTQNTEVPEQLRIHWSWMFKMPPWAFLSYVKEQRKGLKHHRQLQAAQAVRDWDSKIGQELKESIQKYQENQAMATAERTGDLEPVQEGFSTKPVQTTQASEPSQTKALFKHLLSSGKAEDLDEFEYTQHNFNDFHSWVLRFQEATVSVDVKLRNGRKYNLPCTWIRNHHDWISYQENLRSFLRVNFQLGYNKLSVELEFSNVFIFKHHTENPTRDGKLLIYDEMLVCPGNKDIPIEEISIRMTNIQEN